MKPKSNRKPGPLDNCQTPPYALTPLIPYLKSANIHTIWEPAAGEGFLVNALRDNDFEVIASDIRDHSNSRTDDFFSVTGFFEYYQWEAIVTNPPYSIKYDWVRRCYELGKPWALLMPVEMLGTVTGGNLFARYGVQVMMLRPRINFKMPNKGWDGGGAQFPVAWYTWKLNLPSDLMFERIYREPEQHMIAVRDRELEKEAK